MDALLLSRIQFGLTIAFHYIFPTLSIGLGLILVIMEAIWLKTRNPAHLAMTKFWVKIFALIFSIGVASGIVMEFQFGTNWSRYSRYVGDVFGSALAAEGIFAFFLESGFLALLLFGWNKIKPGWHFFATLMVCLGSHFSAIWIVVANSWMQTPAGYHIVTQPDGMTRAEITDFWALVFNPSSVDRLWHVIVGCWQAGAWLVLSVGAWYLIKGRHVEFAKTSMKAALVVAILSSVLQLVSGHESAKGVAEYQPTKMAAFEGHWKTGPGDLYLFGWHVDPTTDDGEGEVRYGLAIPRMLSWLIYGDVNKPVVGLSAFPKDQRPPVNLVFQTYHAMVAIGFTLIGLSALGVFFWRRQTLWTKRWFLWVCVLAVLLPQFANQLGWFSAEVGRQPWIVWGPTVYHPDGTAEVKGLMRTSEGLSPRVDADQVWGSVILFGVMYLLLFFLFIYLMDYKIRHGPDEVKDEGGPNEDVPLLQGDRAAT